MSVLPPFLPGLDLCDRFYADGVRPLLDRRFPGISRAAARLGRGSARFVAHSGRFVEAIHAAIESNELRNLPPYVGSVDQFSDSTDVQDSVERMKRLAVLYE